MQSFKFANATQKYQRGDVLSTEAILPYIINCTTTITYQ